jgi:protein involved in polysaccharide export with SLBB domain
MKSRQPGGQQDAPAPVQGGVFSMRVTVVGIMAAALLWGMAVGGVLAQDTAKPATQEPGALIAPGTGAEFDPNQPIKPGFQLSINTSSAVGPESDLSGPFQVDATGSVQMKLIGLVPLKDLTPSQAADKIAALLKPYIKEPKVTVTIISVPKPVIFLSGAISRPGATAIEDKTTLAEVLTIVGFTDNSDLSKVRVVHKDEKGNRTTREYNFLRWLKPDPGQSPDESQNPVLADRDFVFVSLKTVPGTGSISVEGQVQRPGVVPLRYGVPTLLREVLALSGGPSPTADRRQVSVRRLGVEKPIVVDYDKVEAGDPTQNIAVQPDDVVYVQNLSPDEFINLNGAFVRAGRLPYARAMTLTQAISEAGGVSLAARDFDGRVFRHVEGPDPTRTQVIAFNYRKIRNNEQPDILLEPGDTVEIPQGVPPRQMADPLAIAASVLTVTLLIDRITGGRF